MGHRALLAYRREADADSLDSEENPDDSTAEPDSDCPADSEDARYDLHRSHWGGADFALLDLLSAEEPFATDTHVAVDPDPVATDLALGDITANYLDFLHHEAFYRVGTDYETTAYHVLWFGLEADCEAVARSETVGHGALIEAHPDDADYLRGWFRGTKSVVGEMVDRGALAPGESPELAAEVDAGPATGEGTDTDSDDAKSPADADPPADAESPVDAELPAAAELPADAELPAAADHTTEMAADYLAARAETWAADREVILPGRLDSGPPDRR